MNSKYNVPTFETPERPPRIQEITVRTLKDILDSAPDYLKIYINGNPVIKANSLLIDYDSKAVNLNLNVEDKHGTNI